MYFSRIRIENGVLTQMKFLKAIQGDIYAMHQLIWRLFPDDPDGNRTFLFRQEFEKEQLKFGSTQRGMPIFYVVSEKVPVPVDGIFKVDYKEYHPKIAIGTKLAFEIRVNPVVAKKNEGKTRSVKHDVLMNAKHHAKKEGITDPDIINQKMQAAVVDWLSNKGNTTGFQIKNPEIIEVSAYKQHLLKKKGSKEICFSCVDLSGTLVVTDPVLFTKTLFNGLGSSKAFGCGLMLVRRCD